MSSVHKVYVKTGDVKGAGTDANVTIVINDIKGNKTSKISLDNFFRNDFERGNVDVFHLESCDTKPLADRPHVLELSRDNSGFASDWYLDSVTLATADGAEYVFPFNRWVTANTGYKIPHLDTSLPQHDPFPDQRAQRLQAARETYKLSPNKEGTARIEKVPPEEGYSDAYKNFLQGIALKTTFENFTNFLKPRTWTRLSQLEKLFSDLTGAYHRPVCVDHWQEDWWFGSQRLAGADPTLIRLCTAIPDNLGVTYEELCPFLGGQSFDQVIAEKRLFVCDLSVLKDFRRGYEDRILPAPIALFYVNSRQQLLPVAIQLFQDPAADNPVFFPTDDKYTWLLAKMWYNLAEANHHQTLTHLHFTHLIMESFCLAAHRELSGNHPVFRLLKPHFMFLFNINNRATASLLAPSGLDSTSTIGSSNFRELGIRRWKEWRLDVEGTLPEALKARGVLDSEVLQNYYYRDDALMLYDAIKKYVSSYVALYYHDDSELLADSEIQSWVAALARPRDQDGYGIQGVPLSAQGTLTSRDDLALILTCVVFTCSVQHAAVNFPQYDHFGYSPNYPFVLLGEPPTDKRPRGEEDVVKLLPDKDTLLGNMQAVSIFSSRGNAPLGTPLGSFIVDPPAVAVGKQFQQDLKDIEKTVLERNKTRVPNYDYLNPALIPNSISI